MRTTLKEPVPVELLRPIISKYLDEYETAQTGGERPLSPLVILANEAGMDERRLRKTMTENKYCEFNIADNLMCAMGYGLMGWLAFSDELREQYYAVNLDRNADDGFVDAVVGDLFECGHTTTGENRKPDLCRRTGVRYFRCRRCYNERKRAEKARKKAEALAT